MRRTELRRTSAMRRTGRVKPKRATPRRRESPQWTREEWEHANTLLMVRCGGRCECCGSELGGSVERHHRKRRRDGGDRLSNLLALRPICHQFWTEHPADAKARGIILETHQDPTEVQVLYRNAFPVLLDDEGSVRLAS